MWYATDDDQCETDHFIQVGTRDPIRTHLNLLYFAVADVLPAVSPPCSHDNVFRLYLAKINASWYSTSTSNQGKRVGLG